MTVTAKAARTRGISSSRNPLTISLPVTRLVRLRIGPVVLGTMAPGTLRELEPDEVRGLSEAAGAGPGL